MDYEGGGKAFAFFIHPWAHVMQLPPVDRSPAGVLRAPICIPLGLLAHLRCVPSTPPTPSSPWTDWVKGAVVREPDKPSAPEAPNRDWTEVKKKETVEEPPEPPKEPIYKQLLEFIQSMWRASGSAVEMAQEVNKVTQQERLAQQVKKEPDLFRSQDQAHHGFVTPR
jgi:hypothetical protein